MRLPAELADLLCRLSGRPMPGRRGRAGGAATAPGAPDRGRSRLSVALLFLVTVGCETAGAFAPEGAERFDPPPWFRSSWEEIVACAGLEPIYDFDDLRFHYVDAPMFAVAGSHAFGAQQGPDLYFSRAITHGAVKHELLHAALEPTNGHPEPPFRTCAPRGIVLIFD